ncbi:hypothetical protein [Herbiconiux daphne]|uniref:Asp23/Gls24 family envelope stress response protein n=1 Tax=Herbiconiux daphne TaxID=2970914 RepID=A0ABT2H3T5_9MICO|nr:hypothetical protein [Herbiconiux daphne]MCS5734585.1 hypothetical protein [Herbiconiux daphne]
MNDSELARELGRLVLEVPGVLQSYDTRPAVVAAVTDAAAALLRQAPAEPITLSRGPEGIAVAVKIAVDDDRPAAETCRDVYSVLMDALQEQGPPAGVASISVEVSRIG